MQNEQNDPTNSEFLTFFEPNDMMYEIGDPLTATCENLYPIPQHPPQFTDAKFFNQSTCHDDGSSRVSSSPSTENSGQPNSTDSMEVQQFLSSGHGYENNHGELGFGASIFDSEDMLIHGNHGFSDHQLAQPHGHHPQFDKSLEPLGMSLGNFHTLQQHNFHGLEHGGQPDRREDH